MEKKNPSDILSKNNQTYDCEFIHTVIKGMCDNEDEMKDIEQNVYLKIHEKNNLSFKSSAQRNCYYRRICNSQFIDMKRYNATHKKESYMDPDLFAAEVDGGGRKLNYSIPIIHSVLDFFKTMNIENAETDRDKRLVVLVRSTYYHETNVSIAKKMHISRRTVAKMQALSKLAFIHNYDRAYENLDDLGEQ